MSLVALSQQDVYDLADSEQDCRGWTVRDVSGTALGTCTDMIVDTDAEHIHSLVLDTGATIPAADITLQQGIVLAQATGTLSPAAAPTPAGMTATTGREHDILLPVVEERIKVGKRELSSGGVRVAPRVMDQPVEHTVTLRDERVYVERRPVDQAAAAVDFDAFKEGVIEILETAEEAIVTKHARVVEEVVVRKEVTTRQEVVRDTVTRTDVEVQTLGPDDQPAHEGSGSEKKPAQ